MLKKLCTILLLFWSGAAHAHGLTMTTAGVTVRNQTHLSLRLQYDPLLLWQQIDTENAPASLAAFANLPEAAFEQGYTALKRYLENGLHLRFDAKPVASLQFRFPSVAAFRRSVRERFMRQVLSAQDGAHRVDENHREYYQTAEIDGFLPQGTTHGSLDIRFPPALGEVMVTFSRPHSQTLAPDEEGAHYRYPLTPCGPP